mgnify:CR=1 FL=1
MHARKTLIGLISLSLMSISSCSTLKTKTVFVPSYTKIPDEFTEPVGLPTNTPKDNGDLVAYAIVLRESLKKANRQLEAIRAIDSEP